MFKFKHGEIKSKVYYAWGNIKARTTNPNCKEYKWYGARGIRMCDAWLNSFTAFRNYIGEAPTSSHSIDRIDNSKGYEPGNVRWATQKEQCRNKRNNMVLAAFGEEKTLVEWSQQFGVKRTTISNRINNLGLSAEAAITEPASPLRREQVTAFGNSLGVQFSAAP